jgi:hypothetical protein
MIIVKTCNKFMNQFRPLFRPPFIRSHVGQSGNESRCRCVYFSYLTARYKPTKKMIRPDESRNFFSRRRWQVNQSVKHRTKCISPQKTKFPEVEWFRCFWRSSSRICYTQRAVALCGSIVFDTVTSIFSANWKTSKTSMRQQQKANNEWSSRRQLSALGLWTLR